jgi:aspartate/tyrosine/aromatic aminotransferase
MSFFSNVTQAPPDPILGVSLAYKADTDPNKVDLGIGAYRTEEGKPYVLSAVRKAEQKIFDQKHNKEYLPIDGLAEFKQHTARLLYGDALNGNEKRVAVSQSLSGTGALRLGAEFIRRFLPQGTTVYISRPTWGNHFSIFKEARVPFAEYRYFDKNTNGLDFAGLTADIQAAPDKSVILLHLCAHNPTGVDPTQEQWNTIADIVQKKGHLAFLDCAYQGYATGDLERDAYAARLFMNRGLEFFAAQSYSKNFGLYGERIGAFSVVCASAEVASNVLSQIKLDVRPMYSNPPLHGAEIVATVFGDAALYKEWVDELKGMAGRIVTMRKELFNALKAKGTPLPDGKAGEWRHITDQIGMFSFTGLTPAQCEIMIKKHHIYMLTNGRISMAGLNSKNLAYVANAIHDAVTNAK